MNTTQIAIATAITGVAVQTTVKLIMKKNRRHATALVIAHNKADRVAWLAASEIAAMKLTYNLYDCTPSDTLDVVSNDILFYHTSLLAM